MTELEIASFCFIAFGMACLTVAFCFARYTDAKYGSAKAQKRSAERQEVMQLEVPSAPALWTTTVTTTKKPRKAPKKEAKK